MTVVTRVCVWLLAVPAVLGCGVNFVSESGPDARGGGSAAVGDAGGASTTGVGSGGMGSVGAAGVGGAGGSATNTTSAGGAGGDSQPSWMVVETLMVPVDGTTAISQTVLDLGATYRLRASGTFIISTGQGLVGDAEYFDFSNPPSSVVDSGSSVDHGLAIDDAVVDLNRQPAWGAFSSSHVYEIDYAATGSTIAAQFHDAVPSNNSGTLTLEILALR